MIIHEIKIRDEIVGKAYIETGSSEAIEVWMPKVLMAAVLHRDPESITITE